MFFKMRSAYFVAALSAVLSVAVVASAGYKAEKPEIVVIGKAIGMAVKGKSNKLVIEENDKTITFKTFLNTIDTGIGLRNKHMETRLGKIPKKDAGGKVVKDADGKPVLIDLFEIKLSVPKDKIDPKSGGEVEGTLTFHNVSVPTKVNYTIDGNRVTAKFSMNVNNHFPTNEHFTKEDKEKLLCNAGVCAKPEVAVEVSFNFK